MIGLAAVPQRWGAAVSVVVCLNIAMENDPQDIVDVPADDELADEMRGDVSGGGSYGGSLVGLGGIP